MAVTTPDVTPIPASVRELGDQLGIERAGSWGPKQWVPLSLAAVYLIWGSTYLALKWMIEGLPPLLGAGGRYLAAGGVLYAVLRLRGAAAPTAKQWLGAAPAGLLLFLVGNGFVTLAEREVSSSVAAIVCASMPLLTAGLGVLTGERTTKRELGGLALGFVGVGVMTAPALGAGSFSATILLFAPVGWALGTLCARKLPQAPGLMAASTQMLTGGLATVALGALTGEGLPTGDVPTRSILAFFYLVIAGSLIAFSAYSYLLKNARPSVATSYAYVNPGIAVLLGVLVGGETLGAMTLIGGALVVTAVLIVMRSKAAAIK